MQLARKGCSYLLEILHCITLSLHFGRMTNRRRTILVVVEDAREVFWILLSFEVQLLPIGNPTTGGQSLFSWKMLWKGFADPIFFCCWPVFPPCEISQAQQSLFSWKMLWKMKKRTSTVKKAFVSILVFVEDALEGFC